jgi:hypothetical protein
VKRLVEFTKKKMGLWVLHMGIFWAKDFLKIKSGLNE